MYDMLSIMYQASDRLQPCASIGQQKREKKTTLFGVNLMRTQVLYWAAQ